jgi:hypothetical protein
MLLSIPVMPSGECVRSGLSLDEDCGDDVCAADGEQRRSLDAGEAAPLQECGGQLRGADEEGPVSVTTRFGGVFRIASTRGGTRFAG